jgi:hypothetical protein
MKTARAGGNPAFVEKTDPANFAAKQRAGRLNRRPALTEHR